MNTMGDPTKFSNDPRPVAGILPFQAILAECDFTNDSAEESTGKEGIIRPCNRQNVRSASYDLRLGEEYYLRDSTAKRQREGANETIAVCRLERGRSEAIVVPANRVVLVTMHEELSFPADIVGHVSLKLDLLLRGLIMANQSQIDAGYKGRIFALLYNLSAQDVTLKLGDSILRLELERLPEPSDAPYSGNYKNLTLAQALKAPVWSSLEQLHEDVRTSGEKLNNSIKDLDRVKLWGPVMGILLTVVATAVNFYIPISDLRTKLATLEGRTEEIRAGAIRHADLDQRTTALMKELQAARAQNAEMEQRLSAIAAQLKQFGGQPQHSVPPVTQGR